VGFRVEIQDDARSFVAEPGETVLAAAMRAGVKLPHSCTLGNCGTCRVRLLHGEVDYLAQPLALSPQEAAQGFALACQARPTTDVAIAVERAPVAEPSRQMALVTDVSPFCDSVTHLSLVLPDLDALEYRPGQHMNVFLEDGTCRSFSMASPPDGNAVDFHIRRVPGGRFTDGLIGSLQPGDVLDVELPLGTFRFHQEDYRPLVMVATGTGISPIKGILEALFDDPDCPPVSLYWGMRTEADLYLHDEIGTWGSRLYDFRYAPVLSRPGAAWTGRRGRVQQAVLEDHEDLSEHALYLCGSPAMIHDAKEAFLAHGASMGCIHTDGFSFQSRA
jgi:CDP-4-dehydro-6-deoxyglucose reductase, E3